MATIFQQLLRLTALLIACLPTLAWAAAPAALPDTMAQRLLACTACHAKKMENSDAFFPHIAGKPAGYLYNQLVNFREGRRQYPLMTYMVDHMPEAYLREIDHYFAQQEPVPVPPQATMASATTLARGRELVLSGDASIKVPACIACHGQKLTGVAPAIPGLLGLPRDYINAQFGAWKSHLRRANAPDCMALIATRLSNADVAAVSGWLSTQTMAQDSRPAAKLEASLPLACGGVPPAAS